MLETGPRTDRIHDLTRNIDWNIYLKGCALKHQVSDDTFIKHFVNLMMVVKEESLDKQILE